MKKFTRLLTLLVCLSTLFAVKAQETVLYQQSFDNLNVSDKDNFAPEGWGHIVDSMEPFSYGGNIYVPYENPTTGGALDNKSFLNVGSQLLEDDDPINPDPWTNHKEKQAKDYLITPAINGAVSFYLKNAGSGSVKIYNCTKNGAAFVVDESKPFMEIASSQIAADWKLVELPAVAEGSYLAFRMENVGFDEFKIVKKEEAQAPGYLEKFNNLNVKDHSFAPEGWSHIVENFFEEESYETYYVKYENPSTGGQDGAFLKAGSQSLGGGWVTKDVNDYLITPAIGGEVSFYLKKNKNSGNVKVYKAKKEGGKFVVSTSETVAFTTEAELSDAAWTKATIPALVDGTFLAFRLDNVGIDEFSAATMEVETVLAMEITKVKCTSGRDAITGADNKFEAAFDVTLKNTGNVELTPGTTNYSLTILRTEGKQDVEIVTSPVNVSIKPGATEVVKVSAMIDAGTKEESFKYSIRENLNNQVKYGSWIDTKPYAPEMQLKKEDGFEFKAKDVLDFGLLKAAPVTKPITIVNNGFAPLNITAVTLPDGFSTTFAVPTVVPSGERVTLEVTLDNKKAGTFSGKVAVTADVVGTKEVSVIGAVIDKNSWYEDFEKKEVPSNMLFGENWKLSSEPREIGTDENKQWAVNGSSDEPTMIVTPLLRVKAGQALALKAGKRNNNSVLNVYYSADRKDWKLLKKVAISEFTNEKASSSQSSYDDKYAMKLMVFDNIPEGEWYFGIEGGYVRVDDIFGFELVAVEHDFFVNSTDIPAKGMVNKALTANVNVKNMLQVEAADSYTVKFFFDGKEVAQATADEFAVGDKTFEVNYTPHAAGTFPAYFEIAAGSVVVKSDVTEVTVSEESAVEVKSITAEKLSMNSYAPLSVNYKHSISQTIYTADKLTLAGLKSGEKIVKLSYDGYCSNDKQMTSHVKVYLENTADATVDVATPKDEAQMTLVYEGDVEFIKTGSSQNAVEMFAAQFSAPFEYTGQNLRVVVMGDSESYKQVNFQVDATVQDASMYKRGDGDITNSSWYTTGMPLVNIFTEKEVPTLSGKVASAKYGPLPNVKVKLVSGDVLYTAYTNAEGFYSMSVFQSDKDYKAIIDELPGYVAYEHNELINLSAGSKVVNFTVENLSGVEALEVAGLAVYGAEGSIVVKANAAQVVNVYNVSGRLVRSLNVEEGTTTIEGVMAGFYIVNGTKVVVR